ncbi:unnamed protein product [Adineta steineri]|uniref:NHL repeat containing protein n=2 Tax=Adineta steineri TaxID=433720 RepID=A0A814R8W4_9BILA|nr:unnamed protein product [Adineta steineri]CAF1381422.1 unnamed protein product [Adineta steineri]CAF3944430.1 unnamed protein product [Adineta steineri]
MNDKKQNNDDFHSINVEITPTSTDQSRISFINIIKRKKFIWITIGAVVTLIILSISISLPIVMKKKKNVSQITTIATTTETTAAAITTEELSFTSMSNNNYLKWKLNSSTVAWTRTALGIHIDDEKQMIYIAAYGSDRIVGWKFGEKSGEIVAGGNGPGNDLNQLKNPSDITVDKKHDLLIICDQGNERVVQWSLQNQTDPKIIIDKIKCNGVTIDNNGDIYVSEGENHTVIQLKKGEAEATIVAGGNECGYEPNQLNNPTYIFVDEHYSIYVSDHEYGRVTKWIKNAKEGIIVAKEQIPDPYKPPEFYPSGMAVDHFGNVYVSELSNRQIKRWSEGSKEGYTVMEGQYDEPPLYLFNMPGAISLDRDGNLYIIDTQDDRIRKFDVDVN